MQETLVCITMLCMNATTQIPLKAVVANRWSEDHSWSVRSEKLLTAALMGQECSLNKFKSQVVYIIRNNLKQACLVDMLDLKSFKKK